jgi:DNA-directed RNA polymerase specialized sigma24 family protein
MAKKKNNKYCIAHYTLNNSFMTEAEITEMYALLKKHMYIKYGNWDEDVIQRTILRGLWKSSLYNKSKASKLVWFQSILRFIYIQEVDPNYNKTLSNLRLDDPGSSDDGMNWHEMVGAEEVDDVELEKINLAEKIRHILSSGNYPYLTLRANEKSYDEISKELSCCYNTIYKNIQIEKASLKEELSKVAPDLEQQLAGRLKFHYSIKKLTGKRYVKQDPNKVMELKKCFSCENVFPKRKGNVKTCSKKCSEKMKSIHSIERLLKGKEKRREKKRGLIRGDE